MKLKIKKGQKVKVIAGSQKGRTGEVLEIDKRNLKIKVAGVAVKTHFSKEDGLEKKEAFIDYSNVAATK